MTIQALRFDASQWSFEEAKHWVSSHGHKPIESVPARPEEGKALEARPEKPIDLKSLGITIVASSVKEYEDKLKALKAGRIWQ